MSTENGISVVFAGSESNFMFDVQDETLRRAVQCYNGKNWKKIGKHTAHGFYCNSDYVSKKYKMRCMYVFVCAHIPCF